MTTQPQPVFDPAHELQRSAELLVKQPTFAVPLAVASVVTVVVLFATVLAAVVSIFTAAAVPHGAIALAALIPSIGLGLGAMIVAYACATLLTICAAPDVLADRPVDWRSAAHLASANFWNFALLVLIGGAASLVILPLCLLLIGFPLLIAAWYFTTYASVAVVLDGQDAFQALRTSFRIASTRVPESLVAWIGIVVAFAIGAAANGALGHLPFINVVAAFLIGGFTSAYCELVRVRFYLALRVPGTPSTLTTNAYATPNANYATAPYRPPYVPPTGI